MSNRNEPSTIKKYLKGRRLILSLLGTLIALVVSDGIITNYLISSRLGREGNPFLQTWVGGEGFLTLKILGVLLCALILWDISRRQPKLATISSAFFILIYSGIVIWNLSIVLIA